MSLSGKGLVGYFGFGSLVNRHTLRTDYVDLMPATLKGWRRHWQGRTKTLEEEVALLSIHRHPETMIHGMMVIDKLENLPLVDKREAGYSRHRIDRDQLEISPENTLPDDLFVYVADEPAEKRDDGALLQSYLDAVMQGFHLAYGPDGVAHFVDTTIGFSRPIIRDRSSPRYPRSVTLSQEEVLLFDIELDRVAANSGKR